MYPECDCDHCEHGVEEETENVIETDHLKYKVMYTSV